MKTVDKQVSELNNLVRELFGESDVFAYVTAKTKELLEVNVCIRERIKGIGDIFELNNTNQVEFDLKWKGFEPFEKAQALEILIVSAYNLGVLPDYTDGTSKIYPTFKMGSPSGDKTKSGFSCYGSFGIWAEYSGVGSRLAFHGREAEDNMFDAIKKFLPYYKDSRTL